jgi:ABC-2 type transport system ATP-binding protein
MKSQGSGRYPYMLCSCRINAVPERKSSQPAPVPAIALEDVRKRFGPQVGLDGLTLAVASGSVFGLLGPNGAGKTTTVRVLLGLVRPDAGSARVLGLDPTRRAPAVRARVGVLLEGDGLYARLSARENLEYHARLHRLRPPYRGRRIEELLRSFGLWERRGEPVRHFSRGLRQKLAVARALVHRPPVLLLDEPFSGLDPAAAAELRGRLRALAGEQGVTVLLTTHDLLHVEKGCDRVAVLQSGRVRAEGTLDELRVRQEQVEGRVRGAGLDEQRLTALQREGLISSWESEPGGARVLCTRARRPALARALVERGVALEELHTLEGSLEDVFIGLMSCTEAQAS